MSCPESRPAVLVIGASSRAASWSCHQAGLRVTACDRFADADLRAIAVCCQTPTLRRRDVARSLQAIGWPDPKRTPAVLPAGGLENQPTLWRWLERIGELWAPTWSNVQAVRQPTVLKAMVEAAGLRFPEIRGSGEPAPRQGRWLMKSRHSGGGIQVSAWSGGSVSGQPLLLGQPTDYLQRFVPGQDFSAVYLACRGESSLVGVTQQLTGEERLGALGWWYSGSCGPITVTPNERKALERLGSHLASEGGMEGIFGVDLRRDPAGWWVLEVNPRYPAGAEVLERSYGQSLVSAYRSARQGERLADLGWPETTPLTAKGIWFNRATDLGPATEEGVQEALACGSLWQRPVADVPPAGESIPPGAPVFSVFANPPSPVEAVEMLVAVARVWETLIFATI